MRIGLILAVFNGIDYLERCLKPWIEYRKFNAENQLFVVCLDCKFKENGSAGRNSTDGTVQVLNRYLQEGKIDFFQTLNPGPNEAEVRSFGYNWLKEKSVDVVLSVGGDEVFELDEIDKIFKFVKKEPLITYFRIQYKNYVFDDYHYTLDFVPSRIFRVDNGSYLLSNWYFDDDCAYEHKKTKQLVEHKIFASKIIPGVQVKHYTWNDVKRSREKINYQNIHFGHGAGCGFRYNETENKIEFNPEYFRKTNTLPPEVFEEENG